MLRHLDLANRNCLLKLVRCYCEDIKVGLGESIIHLFFKYLVPVCAVHLASHCSARFWGFILNQKVLK